MKVLALGMAITFAKATATDTLTILAIIPAKAKTKNVVLVARLVPVLLVGKNAIAAIEQAAVISASVTNVAPKPRQKIIIKNIPTVIKDILPNRKEPLTVLFNKSPMSAPE